MVNCREEDKRRRRLKFLYDKLFEEICEILYERDPQGIGTTMGNPYHDEYAPEARAIIAGLSAGLSQDEARQMIRDVFESQFGETSHIDADIDAVIQEISKACERLGVCRHKGSPGE